jgi:hypothetical protein
LNLLATWFFVRAGLQRKRAAAGVALLAVLLLGPFTYSFAFWKTPLLEEESAYNYLQIDQTVEEIALGTHVEANRQSVYRGEGLLSASYYDYALLAPLFLDRQTVDTSRHIPGLAGGAPPSTFAARRPLRLLIIGFGSGTVAKLFRHFHPDAHIDGVEIDPKILGYATSHFHLHPGDANLHLVDGRMFLQHGRERDNSGDEPYDIVFLDAFQDISVPFHLATREFFALINLRLANDGVLVMNVNVHSRTNTDLFDHLARTVQAVFPGVWASPVPGLTNMVLFGARQAEAGDRFFAAVKTFDADGEGETPLKTLIRDVAGRLRVIDLRTDIGVLTDDWAPVEILSQRALEGILRETVKTLFAAGMAELRTLGAAPDEPAGLGQQAASVTTSVETR